MQQYNSGAPAFARLIDRWMETQRACYREDAKRVYYINRRFLDQVAHRWPGDNDRLRRMSPAARTRGLAKY
ncbi:MAG TPA: hypothetical protein ENI71_00720 [Chromatiales bacterium]|nr:hypothetical protein [Chromatiales bacterium]